MTNKLTYIISYAGLAALITVQIVMVVFRSSQLVSFGQQVSSLNHTQSRLESSTKHLQAQLAATLSLVAIEASAADHNYQTISQPIVLTHSTAVASR